MYSTLIFVLSQWLAYASAFTFSTTSPPTECGDFQVDWTGGEAPFQLLLIPPGGTMRNISIPDSAFVNGEGSFSTPLTLRRGRRFVASMSDSTSLVAGGTSELMVVGPPPSNTGCNTTEPNVDFFFSLDSDLEQCRPYPFTLYSNAVQPIGIIGSIPTGKSFVLRPPIGNAYDWMVNVAAGTPIIFSMFDSMGRKGGTADLRIVRLTNDTNCLQLSTPSPETTEDAPRESRKLSSGIIAAIIIGVLIFLASLPIVAILFIRYERRKLAKRNEASARVIDLGDGHSTPTSSVRPRGTSHNDQLSAYAPRPFLLTPHSLESSRNTESLERRTTKMSSNTHSLATTSVIPSGGPSRTSTRRSHIIVHSDIEELDPGDNEVLELPPQYIDRRSGRTDEVDPSPSLPISR